MALLWVASTASAQTIAPDSAWGACPSCQVDDPEAPVASTSIVISGHGWGHGLGMSQWGAYGMARHGFGFRRILRFYYPGTTLGAAPVSTVRVLLADRAQTATIASALPFSATDGSGTEWALPAGRVTLDTTLGLPVGPGGTTQFVAGPITFRSAVSTLTLDGKAYHGSLRVSLVPPTRSASRTPAIARRQAGGAGATPPAASTAGTTTAVAPATAAVPATTTAAGTTTGARTGTTTGAAATPPGTATTAANAPAARPAAAATSTASAAIVSPGITTGAQAPAGGASAGSGGGASAASAAQPGGLRVVDTVDLEAYLAGVVPREVPASWPAAVLQAQAVAARSYALAHRTTDPAADFDLYSDDRSQVYGGVAAEYDASTAAVQATAGQVLLWKGAVADTMFSASNGGRTMSAAEAYPGSPDPPPYLAAKDDPYDAASSPYASWGPLVVPAARLEAALGLPGTLVDLTSDAVGGGRPAHVTAVTSSGTVAVYPSTLRRVLDLKSSWVSIGVLSLARAATPVTYGSRVRLNGLLRNVDGAAVEQRAAGGWKPLGAVQPDADGRFTLVTTAAASTELRLSATRLLAATPAAAAADQGAAAGGAQRGVAGAGAASSSAPAPASAAASSAAPQSVGAQSSPAAAGAPAVTASPAAGAAAGAVTLATPVTGAVLALPVAPRVRLSAAAGGAGLNGVVRPALAGAQIEIQYDGTGTGTTWVPVGTAIVGADGAFAASFTVASGAYRAVVPRVGGLATVPTAPVRVAIAS